MSKQKDLKYQSHTYELILPKSTTVKSVTVDKLQDTSDDPDVPVIKVTMPKETGFFRGIKYKEQNTLLGFANNKWQKLKSIKFGQGANEVFGATEINTIGRLSRTDCHIKDAVLGLA